jgi:hypothetical protein
MKFVIFLCVASILALAQKLPSPDVAVRECPRGWHSFFNIVSSFGGNANSPWYFVEEPCSPEDHSTGPQDYYLSTTRKTKDRDGNPGTEITFRQYGKTWSLQINGFHLWGGRQMKVDEVFEKSKSCSSG